MSRPVRVLQLASPSGLYGAEHWILALVRNLDPRRVESVVATVMDSPRDTGPICDEAARIGIPAFRLEAHGRFNPSAILQLARLLRRERIDIVHSHGYKTDFIGLAAGMSAGCRNVTTPHGWTKNPELALRLYEGLDRVLFTFFGAVVPLSAQLRQSIVANPSVRSRVTLIANGVDLSEVRDTMGVAPAVEAMKRAGKTILGSISRLVPEKGTDCIIKALARHGHPGWHLLLIGDGPWEADLRRLTAGLGVADRVSFLGFRPDRLAFLKGFDVFVLASHSEGTPRCVMEAMAAGVPVVASDIEGCRHLIRHRETGMLFPTGDPRALSDSVRSLLDDAELRRRMIDAASSLVTNHFSAERMAREYEDLFDRLVPAARSAEAQP